MAGFKALVERVLKERPYLRPKGSVRHHPLAQWVQSCRESLEVGRYEEAWVYLHRVITGLAVEDEQLGVAFRHFDTRESGCLNAEGLCHLCAYLGWGEEEVQLLADYRGNKVTLADLVTSVGQLGGLGAIFGMCSQRIDSTQQEVSDHLGISVGARVRAHYLVDGRRSRSWREAQVLAVGVTPEGHDTGDPLSGVLVEFGFSIGESGARWHARQAVPRSWVLSTVEDARVAAALRGAGVLDEQQAIWASMLHDSEMRAVAELGTCQRAVLKLVRDQALRYHEEAFPQLLQRFQRLAYSEAELQAVLSWIRDGAPIVLHVDIEKVGDMLEESETFCWNQQGLHHSLGASDDLGTVRRAEEHDLFGGLYDKAKPLERCQYAALDIMNDHCGVAQNCGDAYLVLKDVRLRCTLASAHSEGPQPAVLDACAQVLEECNDRQLAGLAALATAAKGPKSWDAWRAEGAKAQLRLLRGASRDVLREWITVGFPGLRQRTGRHYFEVQLQAGCSAPQVGLLSPGFEEVPSGIESDLGVGDDEHGWSVDGMNACLWHGGKSRPWAVHWKAMPGGEAPLPARTARSQDRTLSKEVIVGIAVDLDSRTVWLTSNGAWEAGAAFTADDIPEDTELYPALSVKGRACFNFGPSFHFARNEMFGIWPSAPVGSVRVDYPHLGNSEMLRVCREVQLHGEVSLKRNVQRLVAAPRPEYLPKTKRSWALRVAGSICAGTYQRAGAHGGMPLYRSESGGIIYWDPPSRLWRMSDRGDFQTWRCTAPAESFETALPPLKGWKVSDEERGALEADILAEALRARGLGEEPLRSLLAAVTVRAAGGRKLAYRVRGNTSFEAEWEKLSNPPMSAAAAWEAAIEEMQRRMLREAKLGAGRVVESAHPYEAMRHQWTKKVRLEGATRLSVHFAKQTSTLDDRTRLRIYAGGLRREAAGTGARVEISAPGYRVWGTVVERGRVGADMQWKVRLDRCREMEEEAADQLAEDTADFSDIPNELSFCAWPCIGDQVEAAHADGGWHRARVAEIHGTVSAGGRACTRTPRANFSREETFTGGAMDQLLPGPRPPSSEGPLAKGSRGTGIVYVLDWSDGTSRDRRKCRSELRKPRGKTDEGCNLDSLPWYHSVPPPGRRDCFALCTERPSGIVEVAYAHEPEPTHMHGVYLIQDERPYAAGFSDLKPLRPTHIPHFSEWFTVGAKNSMRSHGRFYHEVKIFCSHMCPQIGWLTEEFAETDEVGPGVGDDEHGWGADGMRHMKWHCGATPCEWPRSWRIGDVIGCAIDIAAGQMKFSLNGKWVPAADMSCTAAGHAFYPAVSMGGRFEMNIARMTWHFAPPNNSYNDWATEGVFTRPERAQSPGDEIAGFGLDRTLPLTPIGITGFIGPGPAQEAGVGKGWHLDLVSTLLHPLNTEVLGLFQGMGSAASEPLRFCDGHWRHSKGKKYGGGRITIEDDMIQWPDGLVTDVTLHGNGHFSTEVRGTVCAAELVDDRLIWGDGEIWVLMQPPSITCPAGHDVTRSLEAYSSHSWICCSHCGKLMGTGANVGNPNGMARPSFFTAQAEQAEDDLEEPAEEVWSDVGPACFGCAECSYNICVTCVAGRREEDYDSALRRRLIAAAFGNLDEAVRRLNQGLHNLREASLCFSNSASSGPLKLLPEALVEYSNGMKVGDEISGFVPNGQGFHISSFLKPGPAYEAGVRAEWVFDLKGTLDHNASMAAEEMIKADFSILLAMSDVTLVFRQPKPMKTQCLEAFGPADSAQGGKKGWKCEDVPGDSLDFEFSSDGDTAGSVAARWGFWALVLPKGDKPPGRKALSELAARWVRATERARGVTEPPRVVSDEWNEARLRALCARHGWEFQWMTDEGERCRRTREKCSRDPVPCGLLCEAGQQPVTAATEQQPDGRKFAAEADSWEVCGCGKVCIAGALCCSCCGRRFSPSAGKGRLCEKAPTTPQQKALERIAEEWRQLTMESPSSTASSLWGIPLLHEAPKVLKEGDSVIVVEAFRADDVTDCLLRRGLRGAVVSTDTDGDVAIQFEGFPRQTWVFESHFACLAVQRDAAKERTTC